MSENQEFFALLIDGENVSSKKIEEILDIISTRGKLLIKKVYNNKSSMDHWESVISKHSLDAVWVPNTTKNKNSVDIALAVDAMTLLYKRPDLTGFCIVASDADYTPLAKQISTENKYVLGIGEAKTPEPFRYACTEFICVASVEDEASITLSSKQPTNGSSELATGASDSEFLTLFMEAYKQAVEKGVQDNQGRVTLREIKETMKESDPEFSSREYRQMPKLFHKVMGLAEKNSGIIVLEEQPETTPIAHYVYIKSEIDRFWESYKHAVKDKDEWIWVPLSSIGNALNELYPDYQYLIYSGIKYSQLKKVIEQMMTDYPNVIELESIGTVLQMRFKPQSS